MPVLIVLLRVGSQVSFIVSPCPRNKTFLSFSNALLVGWVAWALPTNLLMQKFPLNKYLAVNVRIHLSLGSTLLMVRADIFLGSTAHGTGCKSQLHRIGRSTYPLWRGGGYSRPSIRTDHSNMVYPCPATHENRLLVYVCDFRYSLSRRLLISGQGQRFRNRSWRFVRLWDRACKPRFL